MGIGKGWEGLGFIGLSLLNFGAMDAVIECWFGFWLAGPVLVSVMIVLYLYQVANSPVYEDVILYIFAH